MSVSRLELFDNRKFQYGPAAAVAERRPNRALVFYPLGSGKTLSAIHAAKTFFDRYPDGEMIVITTKTNIDATWHKNIEMYTEYESEHSERLLGADITNIDWWFSTKNEPVKHYNRLIQKLTEKGEKRLNCIQMSINDLRKTCRRHSITKEWKIFLKRQMKMMRRDLKGYVSRGELKEKDLSGLRRLCRMHNIPVNQSMIQKTIPFGKYILIVDECQEYVNLTAQSHLVQELADNAKFSLLLSATPVHDVTKISKFRQLLGGKDSFWKKKFLYTSVNLQKPVVEEVPIDKVVLTQEEWREHQRVSSERIGGALQNAYLTRSRQACNTVTKWNAIADKIASDIQAWTNSPQREHPLRIVVYSFFLSKGIQGFFSHFGDKFKGKTRNRKLGCKIHRRRVKCLLLQNIEEDLEWFNDSSSTIKILLLSSKSGKGLSLKNVSYFHLMEPQWSDAEEDQAVGRATRKGSHANVEAIVRLYRWIATSPSNTRGRTAGEQMQSTKKEKTRRTNRVLNLWKEYGTARLQFLQNKYGFE